MSEELNFSIIDECFKEDKLKRGVFAKNITKILVNSEKHIINDNKALVLAIDSAWGTGKTQFIKTWKQGLDEMDKFETVYYNAWESDFSSDPLMPIVNEIYINKDFEKKKVELKKRTVELLKYIGIGATKKYLGSKLGIDFDEIKKVMAEKGIDASEIEKMLNNNSENIYFEEFLKYKEIKDSFVGFLNTLTEESKGKKIIFFIDELDRCKPTFAIQTLEVIKHLFNVENFIFVVSLDMDQLGHSIKNVYGEEMDTSGYLRRFFDLHMKIPRPKIEDYVNYIFEMHNLANGTRLTESISLMFENMNLSLREMNSIIKNYKLLLDTSLSNITGMDAGKRKEIFIYFLVLKYKYPEYYNIILNEKIMRDRYSIVIKGMSKQIPSYIHSPTQNVRKFVVAISEGRISKCWCELKPEDARELEVFLESEIQDEGIKINQYIQRKLEMFDYIQQ